VLDAASLMVAGPAAADAVARARAMPDLRVGLHLVVIEGPAVLPPARIPALVGAAGRFPSEQVRLGLRYAIDRAARAQLRAEIAAQFAAFAATGLKLGHADAHKHMHLHPFVGRMMIAEGRRVGLPRIRVPSEPPAVMAALGHRRTPGGQALHAWTRLLRRRAMRAGIAADDHVFGIAWSGHMTAARVAALLGRLPAGSSEIYFHPATAADPALRALMPAYEHAAELAALLDPGVRRAAGRG
jgi:hopanoid biosynthesis associated protein HpnK